MSAGYSIDTEGSEALAAATAETILNYIAVANGAFLLVEFEISFDGVVATNVPVLVELCKSTQATAGTSSPATIKQIRGATRTPEGTARHSYTAEPTVLTVIKSYFIRPDGGLFSKQYPLGREPQQIESAEAWLLRVTAPDIVNVLASMEIEEG